MRSSGERGLLVVGGLDETPLTALRMNAAGLGPGRAADETRLAVSRLEQEIDLIIRAARRPAPDEPAGCDAAAEVRS
jgi:hypothetical protein